MEVAKGIFTIDREPALRTLGFVGMFFGMEIIESLIFPYLFAQIWTEISTFQRLKLKAIFISTFHCLGIFVLAFKIMFGPENDYMLEEVFKRTTESSRLLMSFSAAYFVWDIVAVVKAKPIDYSFLVHGILCFYVYWVAQTPYLHYYGLRFLLFELGTPLLNFRFLLKITNHGEKIIPFLENAFGLVFILVRLIYGIPVMYDLCTLLFAELGTFTFVGKNAEREEEETIVYSVFISLCFAMTALNLFWVYTSITGQVHSTETVTLARKASKTS